jgi:hypothetical protein
VVIANLSDGQEAGKRLLLLVLKKKKFFLEERHLDGVFLGEEASEQAILGTRGIFIQAIRRPGGEIDT